MTNLLTPEDVNTHMISGGIARYDAIRARAEEDGRETSTPPGRHLLRDAVGKMTQAIIDWMPDRTTGPGRRGVAVKYLKMVEPRVAALITAEELIDGIALRKGQRSASGASIDVGRGIEDEARFSKIAKEFPDNWRDLLREAGRKTGDRRRRVLRALAAKADTEWEPWDTRTRLVVGMVLIELFNSSTGMFSIKNIRPAGKKHARGVLVVEPTLVEWLESAHEDHRTRFPLYLPTVEPPEPWVGPNNGGYPMNDIMRWGLIRAPRKVTDRITYESCPEFFSAVNTVQETGWCINQDVFETLDHLWTEGAEVAGLPSRESEDLPPKPEGMGEDENLLKAWKREAAAVYTRNASRISRRLRVARVRSVAELYRNQPFWYPHKADFRGRIYPVPQFLNPQGDDLSKALIQFNEARPVNSKAARDWLAIHGANVWGEDKVPMADRIAWVDGNDRMIRDITEDPLIHGKWQQADKPWQFLAWAMDWGRLRDAEDAGRLHYSHLPVAMDGSNNGLQLYSLLTRDEVGAKATNVSPGEYPQDIYQDVADLVADMMREDAEGLDEKKRAYARNWLTFTGGKVPRACTKRAVMVRPYGGTRQSCVEYLMEWFEGELLARGERDRRPFTGIFAHVLYLATLVEEAIKGTVVKAEEVMDWLREVAGIVASQDKGLEWISPCGLLVHQHRENQRACTVRAKVGTKLIIRWFRKGTGKVSVGAMKNGLPPNFVHSLDASVLVKTINAAAAEGIKSLAMVHDSYATHAADAPALARILREQTAGMFSEDILAEFKNQIEERYGVELPPLPEYGNLDPTCVLESTYFFA